MSDPHHNATLRSILIKAKKSAARLRFFGKNMTIIAEGQIVFVGNGIVGIKHGKTEEADEFLITASIMKVQVLREYLHY